MSFVELSVVYLQKSRVNAPAVSYAKPVTFTQKEMPLLLHPFLGPLRLPFVVRLSLLFVWWWQDFV